MPAVQSKETVLREEGLHCMGLCCSLDRVCWNQDKKGPYCYSQLTSNLQSLGLHNISLFVQCLRNGHEELQQKGLMVISVAKSG